MTPDDDKLDVLTYVATEPEAAIIVGVLTDEGIAATAEGTLTSALRAEVPGDVSIIVRHADLERAQQVLIDYEQSRPDIDWSQVDLGEQQ